MVGKQPSSSTLSLSVESFFIELKTSARVGSGILYTVVVQFKDLTILLMIRFVLLDRNHWNVEQSSYVRVHVTRRQDQYTSYNKLNTVEFSNPSNVVKIIDLD